MKTIVLLSRAPSARLTMLTPLPMVKSRCKRCSSWGSLYLSTNGSFLVSAEGNAVPRECPPFHWAWLYQPKAPNWKTSANLMLVSGEVPGTAESKPKTVLFYFYARDLKSLREELLAEGFSPSEISYPEYLPEGEFRLQDPDGYTLMIAQSGRDTP